MLKELTKETFDNAIVSGKILICFGATWCAPCRVLEPILSKLDSNSNGNYQIIKIDEKENREVLEKYNVKKLPTLILFINGIEQKRFVGLMTESKLEDFLK